MANPFAPEQWDVQVVDESDGEQWTVTLRTQTAGGQLDVGRVADQAGETDAGFARVEDALVSWTFPQELTAHTLRALRADLFGQIVRAVYEGPPTKQKTDEPTPPTPPAETSEPPAETRSRPSSETPPTPALAGAVAAAED